MLPQKHLFQLPDTEHYLNCAYMSPLLKSVEEAGIAGMQKKRNPANIRQEDFFTEVETVRAKFGRLVNGDPQQVAIIPSASYGLQSAISNIPPDGGTHVITVSEEFPSGYYNLFVFDQKRIWRRSRKIPGRAPFRIFASSRPRPVKFAGGITAK